jgi:hypothetical protein
MEQRFRDNINLLKVPNGYHATLGKLDNNVLPLYFVQQGTKTYELGILLENDGYFIFEPTEVPSRYEFIEPAVEWLKEMLRNIVTL